MRHKAIYKYPIDVYTLYRQAIPYPNTIPPTKYLAINLFIRGYIVLIIVGRTYKLYSQCIYHHAIYITNILNIPCRTMYIVRHRIIDITEVAGVGNP